MAETENLGMALPGDGEQGWGSAVRGNFQTLDEVVGQTATESTLRLLLRALVFARDPQDRLRVNVDTGSVRVHDTAMGNNGTLSLSYYGSGAPMAMDAREVQQYQSNAIAGTHRQKWTYT